jgi:shikimate dehydrogenase
MSPVEPRRFTLLGDPVDHSISPEIYTAAFEALDLRAAYSTRRTSVDDLSPVLRAAADGGGGNVTLPHKERVADLLDLSTPEVAATGACNCFWLDRRSRLAGDNTDVGGFLASLPTIGLTSLAGARVLLLGAGGGARAVLHACALQRAAEVDVLNRSRGRALAMVSALGRDISARVLPDSDHVAPPYDLVVNATSLGLQPDDPLPISPPDKGMRAAMDLVYARGGTAWSRAAAERGVPSADGVEMLVQQAALSLRRWYPEADPPLEVMRAAARTAAHA